MIKLRLFLFLGFVLTSLQLFSQTERKQFPNNQADFMKEMDAFMNSTRRKDCKDAYDAFAVHVTAGKLTETRFQAIRAICNGMLTQKLQAFPYFADYLNCVNALLEDDQKAASYFGNWSAIMQELVAALKPNKHGDLQDFMVFSRSLYKYNSIYHNDSGPNWNPVSKDFEIHYIDGELSVEFPSTTLYGIRKNDSIKIEGTSGVYYPLEKKWVGKGAKVPWDRTGLRNVYVTFDTYTIDVRQTGYKATNATLYHPDLFDRPIAGIFEDKILVASEANKNEQNYPRFESQEKKLNIKNIGPGVDYAGGFRLYGDGIIGYGDSNVPATITLFDKSGRKAVKATSTNFKIRIGERILSQDAEVSIYFDEDSIYHPGIDFRYTIDKRQLKLAQGESGKSKTPFFNSYQMIEMFVKTLEWDIDQNKLEIGKGEAGNVSRREVKFESLSLFDNRRFEKYHNVASYNDVCKIATFWRNLSSYRRLLKNAFPNNDTIPLGLDAYIVYRAGNNKGKFIENSLYNKLYEDEKKIYKKLFNTLIDEVDDMNAVKRELLELDDTERKLTAERIAYMLNEKFGVESIGRMLNDLVEDGFIFYNTETHMVILRDKIFHYNDAFIKKVDFDKIILKSAYSKTMTRSDSSSTMFKYYGYTTMDSTGNRVNAVLDMSTKVLQTNWVKSLTLSDTQRVYMKPADYRITMFKNRNMDMKGEIAAGNALFSGEGYHFNYDRFEVKMDSIKYLDLYILQREKDPNNGFYSPTIAKDANGFDTEELRALNSTIENAKGILLIDAPDNKSGKSNIPIFPSFESNDSSYVYYDAKQIRGGRYKRDKFYYKLDPFILDTLDHFHPEYLKLEGQLNSAGIFPKVREPLRVMWHDLSLGFEASSPKAGYPIYGGKGKFTGRYGLSNFGLVGDGEVEYIGSKFKSDDLVFYPDMMKASSDNFNLEEKRNAPVEFPQVRGDSVKLEWRPYKDSMYVRSTQGSPFKFFKEQAHYLDGFVILTPNGLYGSGTFDWDDGTMISQKDRPNFHFFAHRVEADTTQMKIKGLNSDFIAFDTKNVTANVDFDKGEGRFKSNTNNESTKLPFNKFQTNMDDFLWNMNDKTIDIASSDGRARLFRATSVGDKMDSLSFAGKHASYDLTTNLLKIDGVEVIRVADAFIYPGDKLLNIGKDASVDTLYNARIIADTSNQNHEILRAKVKIDGRYDYKADGFLAFDVADKKQEIRFNNIIAKKKGRGRNYITTGVGNVAEKDEFILDKKIRFHGKVNLKAEDKNLQFDGYCKLNTVKIPKSDWFSINSPIDKKKVEIKYSIPRNEAGEKLYAGIFLNRDSMGLYSTVLAPKKRVVDRDIFSVQGLMKFNAEKDEFIFKDTTRLATQDVRGNQMVVSDVTGKIKAEGEFKFGAGFNGLTMTSAGYIDTYLEKSDYAFKMATGLKFILPEALIKVMVADLSTSDVDAAIDYMAIPWLQRALGDIWHDEGRASRAIQKVENTGKLEVGADYTFFFSQFNLQWSDKQGSFFTKGPLYLTSIAGTPVNLILQGHGEVNMTPRGDIFQFSITAASGESYFFSYQAGVMKVFSTNEAFQNAITALKKKDKEFALPDGTKYIIELGTAAEQSIFVKRAKDK